MGNDTCAVDSRCGRGIFSIVLWKPIFEIMFVLGVSFVCLLFLTDQIKNTQIVEKSLDHILMREAESKREREHNYGGPPLAEC